jgi:signal transduction histidine kinase
MSVFPGRESSADPKREATAAIARAQRDLEQAVAELERLPALDMHSIALSVHAMTSFLSITGAVVNGLIPALRSHPDKQIGIWLDGLAHATSLMSHTVSQLMNTSAGLPTMLRIEPVAVATLAERACAYYRNAAGNDVDIRYRAQSDVPTIRTDRVLLAAVLDSLLSNAVKRSPRGARVAVDVEPDGDGVRIDLRDAGGRIDAEDYGLEVARRFVSEMGGSFETLSVAPGQAAVSVRLPRDSSTA